jgi:hypothetical protein
VSATYVICTAAGAKMLAFDSLAQAKAELNRRQKHFTRPLHIVEQRIVERKIA